MFVYCIPARQLNSPTTIPLQPPSAISTPHLHSQPTPPTSTAISFPATESLVATDTAQTCLSAMPTSSTFSITAFFLEHLLQKECRVVHVTNMFASTSSRGFQKHVFKLAYCEVTIFSICCTSKSMTCPVYVIQGNM